MHWGVLDQYKVLFLRYSLADNSDARQLYDNIIATAKNNGTRLKRKQLCESFSARILSLTKHRKISNCLDALRLNDKRDNDNDNYATTEKLT